MKSRELKPLGVVEACSALRRMAGSGGRAMASKPTMRRPARGLRKHTGRGGGRSGSPWPTPTTLSTSTVCSRQGVMRRTVATCCNILDNLTHIQVRVHDERKSREVRRRGHEVWRVRGVTNLKSFDSTCLLCFLPFPAGGCIQPFREGASTKRRTAGVGTLRVDSSFCECMMMREVAYKGTVQSFHLTNKEAADSIMRSRSFRASARGMPDA